MRVHLIHGFNVNDGGAGTVGNLGPYFPTHVLHKIGFIGLINLRCRNREIVRYLMERVAPGDVLVGHSNGALICQRLVEAGVKPRAIVLINPALRRDTKFPEGVPVLCLYSDGDMTVQLGRMWSRLVSLGGIRAHGWGAAGRYGLTEQQPSVKNVNMNSRIYGSNRASGHSTALKFPFVKYWGPFIKNWLSSL